VADEIRKLAEQSDEFTGEISYIIDELKSKTESAIMTMEEMNKFIYDQADSVKDTEGKLEGISVAIENTKEFINILNESGRKMANKKDNIIAIIDNLAAVSQENAAGTEEVSSTIEEQSAAIKQIANASEDLSKLAEDMNHHFSKFKY
jgi:methyl-accepting chemotaxis protein